MTSPYCAFYSSAVVNKPLLFFSSIFSDGFVSIVLQRLFFLYRPNLKSIFFGAILVLLCL